MSTDPYPPNSETGWVKDFPYLRRPAFQSFFDRWSKDQQVLFHGSNVSSLTHLTPHTANCKTNIEGNLRAVYGTDDLDLAVYYAILDKDQWRGYSVAEKSMISGVPCYRFALERDVLLMLPFCNGSVYVIEKTKFQLISANAQSTYEWYHTESAAIIDSIEVSPSDFKFLPHVIPIETI